MFQVTAKLHTESEDELLSLKYLNIMLINKFKSRLNISGNRDFKHLIFNSAMLINN